LSSVIFTNNRKDKKMFDLLIQNARIIDGTGAKPYAGWIGIRMEEIAELKAGASRSTIEAEARQVVDAGGKILCPGFIDIHSHSDISLIPHPFTPEKIWQGITTHTTGHCGISAAPMSKDWQTYLSQSLLGSVGTNGQWESFDDYMTYLSKRELGTNVAPLVGYAPIRMAVLGNSSKEPDRKELKKMVTLLDEAMQAGSFGFTTGLAYPPQCQATTDELAALCEVVAHHDGIYASHVRDIIFDFISGLKEAIEIGRRSGVRVHIAHLQVRPNPYYGLQDVLNLMEDARQEGIEVTCDQYAYLAGQGPLTPLFPAWALGGGVEAIRQRLQNGEDRKRIKQYMRETVEQYFKWSDIVLWSGEDEALVEKSLQTLAHIAEKDPCDVVMDLLLQHGLSTGALYFGKTEEDLCSAAAWKHSVVGTDGVFFENKRQNHPRTFGTFPRMIRKYVREQSVFSLEEAVHRMSGQTAAILGLSDRGVIAEGKKADLLIIDPDTIRDTATYTEPVARAQGIDMVIVNGKIVKSGDTDQPGVAGRVLALK
jgi:N-acyl-D-amino-acid deacylase